MIVTVILPSQYSTFHYFFVRLDCYFRFITYFIEVLYFYRKLTSLDLSSNPIVNFEGKFLRGLPLEKLNLRGLSLTFVPRAIKVLVSKFLGLVVYFIYFS